MIVWFVCIVLSVVVMCGGIGLEFSNGRLVKVLVGVDEMDIKDMWNVFCKYDLGEKCFRVL